MGEFVRAYNEQNQQLAEAEGVEPAPLKQRGASSVDLPAPLMVSFFSPLFDQIKQKVHELMTAAREEKGYPVNFIFMVGGFSESPFLKAEIKKAFEVNAGDSQSVHVLVPRRPQVSVIRGACMFGLNPRSITSRISKMTYGINTLTTYDN